MRHFCNADGVIREMAQSILVRPTRFGCFGLARNAAFAPRLRLGRCKFDWQINEYRKVDTVNKTGFLG
jgi:hypothetical protein